MATTVFATEAIDEPLAVPETAGRGGLFVAAGISILIGPFAYLICRALNTGFAPHDQALALAALCIIGFEAAWLAYGLVLLIARGRELRP